MGKNHEKAPVPATPATPEKAPETVPATPATPEKAPETVPATPDPILAHAKLILVAQGNLTPTDEQIKLLAGILSPMIESARTGIPMLSKETREQLEKAATEAKGLGIKAVLLEDGKVSFPVKAPKGTKGKREVATANLYEVKGPGGKAFTVKKGEKYDSLIDLAKGEGLYKEYWEKHPPKDGKEPEDVSISYNKVICSFKDWTVEAK